MMFETGALSGDLLDWAVVHALNAPEMEEAWLRDRRRGYPHSFSRDWDKGGWLVEQCVKNGMLLESVDPQYREKMPFFKASLNKWESIFRSDTILEVTCRTYVGHKLGECFDIPDEIVALFQPPQ